MKFPNNFWRKSAPLIFKLIENFIIKRSTWVSYDLSKDLKY
jgi:hypothetical protein